MKVSDFIEKYDGQKMMFSSYYKYKFTYKLIDGDTEIFVDCGDTTGDIYRDEWSHTEVIGKHLDGFIHSVRVSNA